jgi:predicted transcriptional regulator
MQTDKKIVITLRNPSTLQYIKFFNGIFGMSDKELEYLAAMIDGDGDFGSSNNRAHVAASMSVSKTVVNTYVKRIKDRGAIKDEKGKYSLHKLLERNSQVDVVVSRKS